jgi:2-keto-3-deoxy-L-arabinonate dehydratase
MMRLNGIIPVMATPFRDDESIDESALRRQIDFTIDRGAVAVCGPGYASEFYKMSDAERWRFAEILVDQARKRVPAIVATSCGSTYNTVEFSRYAERAGAGCLMVTAPRTTALPLSEVVDYYRRLCDSVGIPVMLQDADFTGPGLPSRVFLELAENHPNFLFAKLEVTLPGQKCAEIVEGTGGRVQVIYGLGGIAMLDGLAHGASGVMPGAAAVDVYTRIYELYHCRKKDEARALFHRLLPYLSFALQHLELAIQIEKRVLQKRGVIPQARMRRPAIPLDQRYQEQMEELSDLVISLAAECAG